MYRFSKFGVCVSKITPAMPILFESDLDLGAMLMKRYGALVCHIQYVFVRKRRLAIQNFLRKLQTLFFLPSLYFISKCKDAIPSWPVLNFEMFVSSFTLCLLLILSSILFNTDHTVTFYQISNYQLIQTWIKLMISLG